MCGIDLHVMQQREAGKSNAHENNLVRKEDHLNEQPPKSFQNSKT